ncbi:MAG: ribonuclease III [Candidatus Omnitrophota bacterium]|nr:ribonuclease III [Candidatus Omnitrophota bacterium]
MAPKNTPSIAINAKKALKIRFNKNALLEAALTHPSYRNENRCPKLDNFDRMEFFGDAVLNYIICRKLYTLFPDADEGQLSRLRSTLVSRRILSRIAKDLGLANVMLLGKSLRRQSASVKSKVLADTFEAVIAAVYLDQGLARVQKFILDHFTGYFDAKRLLRLDPNPKSLLQEICQKHWQKLPQYARSQGTRGIKTEIRVRPGVNILAWGRTRRASEEKAARLLIRKIRQRFSRPLKKSSSGKK